MQHQSSMNIQNTMKQSIDKNRFTFIKISAAGIFSGDRGPRWEDLIGGRRVGGLGAKPSNPYAEFIKNLVENSTEPCIFENFHYYERIFDFQKLF